MRKTLTAAVLALGVMLALSSAALAHDDDDNRGDARQSGYDRGYRDGYRHGDQDRDGRRGYDYRSDDYQRGDRGYDSDMGSRGQYKQGYREGYRTGYDDGYYGRQGRYGYGGWRNGDPDHGGDGDRDRDHDRDDQRYGGQVYGGRNNAYQYGYRDGLNEGSKDRATGHSFRPTQHAAYQDADHGQSISGMSKSAYKTSYREGYMRGYQQGYNGR